MTTVRLLILAAFVTLAAKAQSNSITLCDQQSTNHCINVKAPDTLAADLECTLTDPTGMANCNIMSNQGGHMFGNILGDGTPSIGTPAYPFGSIYIKGSSAYTIRPTVDGTASLGTTGFNWGELWVKDLHISGTVSGVSGYLSLSGGTMTGSIFGSGAPALGSPSFPFGSVYIDGSVGVIRPVVNDTSALGTTGYRFNKLWVTDIDMSGSFTGSLPFLPLAGGVITGSILPSPTSSLSLGGPSNSWFKLYSDQIKSPYVYTSSSELQLQETGDTFGIVNMFLHNRSGENGVILENAGVNLVDFQYKTSTGTVRNIRLENRFPYNLSHSTVPLFRIGGLFTDQATLNVSDSAVEILTGPLYLDNTGLYFPDGTLQTTAFTAVPYLPLSGGTMTGSIFGSGAPSLGSPSFPFGQIYASIGYKMGGTTFFDSSLNLGTIHSVTMNGTLTTGITGSTQCLQADSAGVVTGTGTACFTGSYLPLSGGTMTGSIFGSGAPSIGSPSFPFGQIYASIGYKMGGTTFLDSSMDFGTVHNITLNGTLTTAITGSTQCLQVNSSGVVSGTGTGCFSGSYLPLSGGTMTGSIFSSGGASLGSPSFPWFAVYAYDSYRMGGTTFLDSGRNLFNIGSFSGTGPVSIGGATVIDVSRNGSFVNLTLGITGSTQCLHVSNTGVVSGTGTDCGGLATSGGTMTGSIFASPTHGPALGGPSNYWSAVYSDVYKSNSHSGISSILTVRDSAGTGTCTITVEGGIITSSTC